MTTIAGRVNVIPIILLQIEWILHLQCFNLFTLLSFDLSKKVWARFVSRDASQLMRCCHRTAQGWLGDWRYGLPLYRAVTLQSYTKTALQSVGMPLAHPDRERWWRRYVTLLQTVQIEAHYVAELAMQKRWLKANCHDWTRPGLPFCFKWANLKGINDRQKHPMEPTTILMRIYSIRVD